jgi:elongator complex protein 3
MDELHIQCNCIRCREYGHRLRDGYKIGEPHFDRMEYEASGGRELFLSFVDEQNTLFGLLRLRIGLSKLGDNGDTAIVRELHVFGSEVPLGEQGKASAQHKGLGSELLREAERISREEFGAQKIAIISGVGARDYFRTEFGYALEGAYMVKELPSKITA